MRSMGEGACKKRQCRCMFGRSRKQLAQSMPAIAFRKLAPSTAPRSQACAGLAASGPPPPRAGEDKKRVASVHDVQPRGSADRG